MGRLSGAHAVITGAGSGMGAATARRFVEEGATVLLLDLDIEAVSRVGRPLGGQAVCRKLDVSNLKEWQDALAGSGPVDALVNAAGIAGRGDQVRDAAVGAFRELMDVNLFGAYYGMVEVVPLMGPSSSIINVSSTAGLRGTDLSTGYTTSKWALRGMSKAAALELAPVGIRVNSVHPGVIDTPMSRNVGTAGTSGLPPLGRLGKAEEVAELIVYLASGESGYCTGAEFVIDGGATAGIIRRTQREEG